jgi:hypothetical protein
VRTIIVTGDVEAVLKPPLKEIRDRSWIKGEVAATVMAVMREGRRRRVQAALRLADGLEVDWDWPYAPPAGP